MTAVSAEASGARGAPSGNPDVPEAGQLVRVRGQQWVVSQVNNSHQPQDELAATRTPRPYPRHPHQRQRRRPRRRADRRLGDRARPRDRPRDPAPSSDPSELGRPAATRRLPRRRPLGHRGQRRHPDASGPVPVRHHDRGVPARTRRPCPRHAEGQPAHRRRRGPRQDDRGRPGRAGDAAATPGTARHRRLPGVAHAQVARGDGGQVRPRLHDRGHRPAQGTPAIPWARSQPLRRLPAHDHQPAMAAHPSRPAHARRGPHQRHAASPASSTC